VLTCLQLWKPEPPRRLAQDLPPRLCFQRQHFGENPQVFRVRDLRRPQIVGETTRPDAALRSVRIDDLQARAVQILAREFALGARADEVELRVEFAKTGQLQYRIEARLEQRSWFQIHAMA